MTSPSTVKVKMIGNVNGDNNIDMQDIYIVVRAFGSYPDHPNWNPSADLDEDDQVDIRDIYLIITNFGKSI